MHISSPLISAEWLKDNSGALDLRIIEATYFLPFLNPPQTGYEAYLQGHIPGSVYFDIDRIAAQGAPLPHTLPDPVEFSSRIRPLGIGDGHRLVIYDRNRFIASARVWWMLRHMGVKDVFVLDGGLAAWTEAGGELDDREPRYPVRHFTPRLQADLVKTLGQMKNIEASASAQIVDVRPQGRFTGQAAEPRAGLPSGHMPGSLNMPYSLLLTEAGYLKSTESLLDMVKKIGLSLDKPIVSTCGSGVTAPVLTLALAKLGQDRSAVYDGSWAEWASQTDTPIATL